MEDNAPLLGLRILNTRPLGSNDTLANQWRQLGAHVIDLPLTEIVPPNAAMVDPLRKYCSAIQALDVIVVTSANGISALCFAAEANKELKALWQLPVAAIGQQTAKFAAEKGFKVAYVARTSNSEAFASELIEFFSGKVESQRLILIRGSKADASLSEKLSIAGVDFLEFAIYDSRCPEESEYRFVSAIDQLLNEGGPSSQGESIDALIPLRRVVVFTNALGVRAFAALKVRYAGELRALGVERLDIDAVTIGPKTARAAEEEGFRVVATALLQTLESLTEMLCGYSLNNHKTDCAQMIGK